LAREYELEIEYIHFPLHPETPPEGVKLLDLFGGPSAAPRLEASRARLAALAKEEGLPMSMNREMTYNSRIAQELGAYATTQGHGMAFHDQMFVAYFVKNENISDPTVLLKIAQAAGLDPAETKKVMNERSFEAAVDLDWQRSREAGVTGVPTFSIKGKSVVGAQPIGVLRKLVEAAGVPKRTS